MLQPRPHWTTYALEGRSIPVARLLALRDQVEQLIRIWRGRVR